MIFNINVERVQGLTTQEKNMLKELLNVHQKHLSGNVRKEKYYEGDIPLSEVNLGIALPKAFRGLEIGCPWGAKTVDVLAARSMFDGFVDTNGESVDELTEIVMANRLIPEYMKTCRDELKFGCTFATLSADSKIKAKIRFHSPKTSAARSP